jgi:uncharacterized membrane protein YgdD (TMEM256/DUF423 family)
LSFPVIGIEFTIIEYLYSISFTQLKFIIPNSYLWVILGSTFVASAILLGAYGAHGLEDAFAETPRKERAWANAVDYQMFHGLALVVIGFYRCRAKGLKMLNISAWLIVFAWLLFCVSIYAWVMGGSLSLIKVTPFGGILFFVSWVLIAAHGFINVVCERDE